MNEDIRIRFKYRFFKLSKQDVKLIEPLFKSNNYDVKNLKSNKKLYTVIVNLNQDINENELVGIIEKLKSEGKSNFGLFISIVSECDSVIANIPNPILKIYRKLGGCLDVSYTVI